MSANIATHPVKSQFQILRPFLWWLLLLLILFGIREHQRLMETTRLNFSLILSGQQLESVALLDEKTFNSGENISVGRHTFTIRNSKIDTFTTNFFAWYGKHDLGLLILQRSTGSLKMKANPMATTITVTGPEYSVTVTNSIGLTLTVPTDAYNVRAEWPHGSQVKDVTMFDHQTAECEFAPIFGALHLTSNKGDTTYSLQSATGEAVSGGDLPILLNELPTGNYQLTASHHHWQNKKSVIIDANATNDLPIEFVFGAVHLATEPSGVEVRTVDGNYWGQTPLNLSEVPPQTAHLNLSLAGYEPASITLAINADQTTEFHTNLTSINYLSALQSARAALVANNYRDASQFAARALIAKPGDTDALALQAEADKQLAADRERFAQLKRPREVFDTLCRENPDASLFAEHELTTDKPAKDTADAIAKALTSEPRPFELVSNDSPQTDCYKIMVRQTFSLGILGGTERGGLITVGRTKTGETKIYFKVLEYQVKNSLVANGTFSFKDNKQMIPVHAGNIQMTPALENQVKTGVRLVAEKIQSAISQTQ